MPFARASKGACENLVFFTHDHYPASNVTHPNLERMMPKTFNEAFRDHGLRAEAHGPHVEFAHDSEGSGSHPEGCWLRTTS